MEKGHIWAVVVAAGRGERFGKPYNKVFHPLNRRSILGRSIQALSESAAFEGIVLVISGQDAPAYQELANREHFAHLIQRVVYGGATRQDSVLNGLAALPEDAQMVAIHDAARPFVSSGLIHALIDAAEENGAAVPGTPMTDTVKIMDQEGFAVDTPERSRLCAVQTPQVFRLKPLMEVHRRAKEEGVPATDDASLYEKYAGRVSVVMMPDCQDNIKVTTQQDVEKFMPMPVPRVGQGYDAHRLVEGRDLILCGVNIPYEKGLLGHSDADVAVHALMDALLGAAGQGDIGRHFPDSDMRYKGISSMKLLECVMELLKERGLVPTNVDVTIVAQRPKLKDYMAEMKENLCNALNLEETYVNVKATTTEKMGFEGEGQGISAQAVALLIPVRA